MNSNKGPAQDIRLPANAKSTEVATPTKMEDPVEAIEETVVYEPEQSDEGSDMIQEDLPPWPYESFSREDAESWKAQVGAIEVKVINGIEYVYRGLRRGEHNVLIPDTFEGTREAEEDKTVSMALLSPVMSEHQISESTSGIATNLFQEITRLSNFLPPNVAYIDGEFFPIMGTQAEMMAMAKELVNEIWPSMGLRKIPSVEDFSKWIARKMPMAWSILEDRLFVQIAQTRRQFKRYRIKLQEIRATQTVGQELLTEETVVFPDASSFDPRSDDFLSGTIKQLSDRAMILGAFDSQEAPVRL